MLTPPKHHAKKGHKRDKKVISNVETIGNFTRLKVPFTPDVVMPKSFDLLDSTP